MPTLIATGPATQESQKDTARIVPKEATPKLQDKYEWKKVEAPRRWNPHNPGDELCGFYGGKTLRTGSYGQYEVVLVHVPNKGTFMVSGVRIVQLVDASGVEVGWPVRIIWGGTVALSDAPDRRMKTFQFFVAEGEPVAPERLPKIKE